MKQKSSVTGGRGLGSWRWRTQANVSVGANLGGGVEPAQWAVDSCGGWRPARWGRLRSGAYGGVWQWCSGFYFFHSRFKSGALAWACGRGKGCRVYKFFYVRQTRYIHRLNVLPRMFISSRYIPQYWY
jgi:hypothetical protein